MLWARRGLSWMQKLSTLYPSSPSEDAADAPASPVPTTMMVNLRRLAGLTSFDSNRCRSHFSARAPPGILESRIINSMGEIRPDRDQREADANEDGEEDAEGHQPLRVDRMVETERLEAAGDTVAQVQPDQQGSDDIENDPQRVLEHFDLCPIQIPHRRLAGCLVPSTELELADVNDHE